jgi:hypothetical protein
MAQIVPMIVMRIKLVRSEMENQERFGVGGVGTMNDRL